MEAYKPLVTKKGLKKLCKKAVAKYDTPLSQARSVIEEITKLRAKRPIRYEFEDWQDEPENRPYMKIATEYHNKRLARIRKRKEKSK